MNLASALKVMGGMGLGLLIALAPAGCSSASGDANDGLVAVDESAASGGLTGTVAVGSTLTTTGNLNLRSGPSTSDSVLHVIPKGASVTVVAASPSNGFYNVKHAGSVGWSFGAYLELSAPPPSGGGGGGGTSSSQRDAAVARAQEGVGFSYWWGHGRWLDSGPTSSSKGTCSGSCPSCSHGGTYGADCSGYVAKIWEVPSTNDALSVDSHPYATGNFFSEHHGWHDVSRASVQKGDALVYNSGGEGHIFLYESGDGWGSMWAYEAKGCSYGIVHDLRTASTAYKAIGHDNW